MGVQVRRRSSSSEDKHSESYLSDPVRAGHSLKLSHRWHIERIWCPYLIGQRASVGGIMACVRPDCSRASVVLFPLARGHRKTRETRHLQCPDHLPALRMRPGFDPIIPTPPPTITRTPPIFSLVTKVVAAMVEKIDTSES